MFSLPCRRGTGYRIKPSVFNEVLEPVIRGDDLDPELLQRHTHARTFRRTFRSFLLDGPKRSEYESLAVRRPSEGLRSQHRQGNSIYRAGIFNNVVRLHLKPGTTQTFAPIAGGLVTFWYSSREAGLIDGLILTSTLRAAAPPVAPLGFRGVPSVGPNIPSVKVRRYLIQLNHIDILDYEPPPQKRRRRGIRPRPRFNLAMGGTPQRLSVVLSSFGGNRHRVPPLRIRAIGPGVHQHVRRSRGSPLAVRIDIVRAFDSGTLFEQHTRLVGMKPGRPPQGNVPNGPAGQPFCRSIFWLTTAVFRAQRETIG